MTANVRDILGSIDNAKKFLDALEKSRTLVIGVEAISWSFSKQDLGANLPDIVQIVRREIVELERKLEKIAA